MRDYIAWHDAYDDPDSTLSWRLRTVQHHVTRALDGQSGAIRIVSSCAGDGRDVIGVLAARNDASRVRTTLLEIDPELVRRAREAARAAGLDVDVRAVDAGVSDAYADAVPADIVLLVGIFGNIADADVERTVRAVPQLCAPGATVLWSRGRSDTDINGTIRGWFADAGLRELDYATHEQGGRPSIGVHRYDGGSASLEVGQRLFTFLR